MNGSTPGPFPGHCNIDLGMSLDISGMVQDYMTQSQEGKEVYLRGGAAGGGEGWGRDTYMCAIQLATVICTCAYIVAVYFETHQVNATAATHIPSS